jgi:hypothetical protein
MCKVCVCVCIRRRNKCKVALNSVNMFAMFCVCVIYIYTMGFSVLQISAVRMFCVFVQNYQGAAPLGWNVASNILQHGRSVKINDKFICTLCEMRTTKNLHSWIHTPETTYSVCITVVEFYIYICICIYIYMLLILVYLLDWLDAMIPNSEYSWVDIASALLPFENPAWD